MTGIAWSVIDEGMSGEFESGCCCFPESLVVCSKSYLFDLAWYSECSAGRILVNLLPRSFPRHKQPLNGRNYFRTLQIAAKKQNGRNISLMRGIFYLKRPLGTQLQHRHSGIWHLASVQSSLRDVDPVVCSVHQAAVLVFNDVRAWHLLGFMLATQEEWKNAPQVFELPEDAGILYLFRLAILNANGEAEAEPENSTGDGITNGTTTAAADASSIETRDFVNVSSSVTNGTADLSTPNLASASATATASLKVKDVREMRLLGDSPRPQGGTS